MKLETGKRYICRDGSVTGPMTMVVNNIGTFPYAATVDGHGTQRFTADGKSVNCFQTTNFDIMAEYVEEKPMFAPNWKTTEPETTEQYIRRLEHNIEVMRHGYLPARLEIAAQAMAGLLSDQKYCSHDPESVAKKAFQFTDALIAEYQKTEQR